MANTKTYSEKLRDPRWQKKRLLILNRDKFACKLCGDTDTELHVHHLKYSQNPWDVDNNDLITYCKHCHLLIETLKPIQVNVNIVKVHKLADVDGNPLLAAKSDRPLINFFKIKWGNELDYYFSITEADLKTVLKNLK